MGLSPITAVQVAAIGVFLCSSFTLNLTSCICVLIVICTVFMRKRLDTDEDNPFKRQSKRKHSEINSALMASAKSAVFDYVTYKADEGTESLQRFNVIKNNTECIFAKTARLWGSQAWRDDVSLERNIERSLPTFVAFTSLCMEEPLDGFVYELPSEKFGQNLEQFAEAVCFTLKVLSNNDPRGRKCMDQKGINKRGWVFEFNRVTFFITTFAPFYPESHSRFSFGAENCYILLQPEVSFARHDLGPDTPRSMTEWDNPKTPRDRIRCAFRNAGRAYRIPEKLGVPLAHEIIRPIRDYGGNQGEDYDVKDDVVDWWQYRTHYKPTVKMVSLDEELSQDGQL